MGHSEASEDQRPVAPLVVVAGVLRNACGQILLAQRPASKSFAGQWEFPGGKRETCESNIEALVRELNEELGVEVIHAHPRMTVVPDTEHKRPFRIEVFDVTEYRGALSEEGLEGQALCWVEASKLLTIDVLKADLPILLSLMLPSKCMRWTSRSDLEEPDVAWVCDHYSDEVIQKAIDYQVMCFVEIDADRVALHPKLRTIWPNLGFGQILPIDAHWGDPTIGAAPSARAEVQFNVWRTPIPTLLSTDQRAWHLQWQAGD